MCRFPSDKRSCTLTAVIASSAKLWPAVASGVWMAALLVLSPSVRPALASGPGSQAGAASGTVSGQLSIHDPSQAVAPAAQAPLEAIAREHEAATGEPIVLWIERGELLSEGKPIDLSQRDQLMKWARQRFERSGLSVRGRGRGMLAVIGGPKLEAWALYVAPYTEASVDRADLEAGLERVAEAEHATARAREWASWLALALTDLESPLVASGRLEAELASVRALPDPAPPATDTVSPTRATAPLGQPSGPSTVVVAGGVAGVVSGLALAVGAVLAGFVIWLRRTPDAIYTEAGWRVESPTRALGRMLRALRGSSPRAGAQGADGAFESGEATF